MGCLGDAGVRVTGGCHNLEFHSHHDDFLELGALLLLPSSGQDINTFSDYFELPLL